ncbi:hypothetical protein AJ80_00973 [Polytolypa hystricis UAMH7299]|uniref:Alpha-1,6-mannosyltransferase subunit n=1 Tax=Polytolypa hystricis (strain UAMH7299) TaxID=1447883 RepID=A0A2B7Z1Z9_POLH7|nr:hypothetical protein AJ80_00973 [Polytolypa hystricis UAMH7299]
MQFALPPRRASHSPYPRSSPSSSLRRRQLKSFAILACVVISILFLFTRLLSSDSSSDGIVTGGPKVVIVTVLDEQKLSDKHIQRIKQNREDYAERHGYVNFFASTSEYAPLVGNYPRTWAIVPAMRHALTLYPGSQYFFHLSPHAMITNPTLSLTSHVLDKHRLERLMIKDTSVVPPDSVIKTFSHLAGNDVDLVITQDGEDLVPDSFIIRKSEWASFFLDSWFDPLYRSYNFAKAEKHALDHIIQWHPTLLAKLALVPQRVMNAYSVNSKPIGRDGLYQDNDFIINFAGCEYRGKTNCETEMEPYFAKWTSQYQG